MRAGIPAGSRKRCVDLCARAQPLRPSATMMGLVPPTRLGLDDVRRALVRLGHQDDTDDDEIFVERLRRFQQEQGLTADGVYGPRTEAKLLPLVTALDAAGIGELEHCLRWRGTYYYIGEQARHSGAKKIPMLSPKGALLATVEAGCFAEAALEGTTRLRDGRLLNVGQNPPYRACDPLVFAPVVDIARRNGWIPKKPGYAGLRVSPAGQAASARTFSLIKPGPNGFPVIARQECLPFRTLAADVGALASHDPRFRGKGGVVPRGTRVFVLEFVGKTCVDAAGKPFVHDGWFVVNDTGGGIFGAHFDVFAGFHRLAAQVKVPSRLHIWFAGCEAKLGRDYALGL
jgi:hypothetical protein